MNNSNLPITALDFDNIKESLKSYLRGQTTFKDYDFEGSGMNILLDLLAYNTHYQAFYANMVANETFLDSAVSRPSVVSIAKHLGYSNRSIKASRISVNVNFGSGSQILNLARQGLFIVRGSAFATTINGETYTFLALDDHKINVVNGQALATNVPIYEGKFRTSTYVFNDNDPKKMFDIIHNNADIDTIRVTIQKSPSDSTGVLENWVRASDINNLDGESRVFFVQEGSNGRSQIYFGDGVIGRTPNHGNLIIIEYLTTIGPLANGASTFSFLNTDIPVTIEPTVSPILGPDGNSISSYGGRLAEDIQSIKYYAPRNYQAQERAVTAEDYETLLAREYSDQADSFLVWGGEENDPPQYGKVFISMKPKNGTKISDQEKFSIEQTILGKRNLVSITPSVVDPDYIYIVPNITVYYDINKTNLARTTLETLVREKTLQFEEEQLLNFNRSFRASRFSAYIDASYPALNSTSTAFSLQKRLEPLLGRVLNYTIKFDNPILHPIDGYPPVISSTAFGHQDLTSSAAIKPTVTCYMEDDGFGTLRIYKFVAGQKITVRANAGTVNYAAGTLSLTNFNPLTVLPSSSNEINFTAQVSVNDINTRKNQIILFDRENITVTMVQETFRTDRNQTGAPLNR